MIGVLLNGQAATRARVSIPGTGAWMAELDIDLDATRIVPSGRVALTIGTDVLTGTIDPRSSGRMGERATVHVIAGGGGWDKIVPAVHLHNDFGVTSTSVYSVTAASVGEAVLDASPRVLGVDFVRSAGPASRVLAGVAWYVDATGITTIGPRAPRALGADATILEWDPLTMRAVIAADSIIWPGTLLVDTRFGTATVRDVEQTFDEAGVRAIAWCETGETSDVTSAGTRLARALASMARESVGATFMRTYRYRTVLQGVDGRLTLQAVTRGGPTPDILTAVSIWSGVAGASQKVTPGSVVLVGFIAGDASKPIVIGFDPDAPAQVEVSFDAARVAVGAGTNPVAMASAPLLTFISQVAGYINGIAPGTVTPVLPAAVTSTRTFTE